MNNHSPHNHNEQRPDERPFRYIVSIGLLRQKNEHNNAAAQISHLGVLDHNQARINPDRAGMRYIGVASTLSVRR